MPKTSQKHPDATAQDAVNAFRRIFRELRVAAMHTETTSGISGAQLFVLTRVAASPSTSLTELADRTLTDRTSVAAAIRRLAEKGLVTTTRSRSDARKTSVSITASGRRLLEKSGRAPTDILLNAITLLSHAELRRLTKSLELLVSIMGLTESPAPMLFDDPKGLKFAAD